MDNFRKEVMSILQISTQITKLALDVRALAGDQNAAKLDRETRRLSPTAIFLADQSD